MALISCPECGKEISDAVPACPHCGYPLHEPQAQDVDSARAKKKKVFLVGAAVVCILALLIAVGAFSGVQRKRSTYIASLNELREQAIRGGSIAEGMCNITKKVWYNTIYEEKDSGTDKYTRRDKGTGAFHNDFNTSLSTLYADEDVVAVVSGLRASREVVDGIMTDLQNPTGEFSACYAAADSLYDAYCGLVDLAISPSGSLKSYSENFGEYDEDLLKYYNKLETLIPSE